MTVFQVLSLVSFLCLVVWAVQSIDWKGFLQIKKQQHLVFGAAASLTFLWIFRAGIYDGLDVHFLWLAALALIMGLRWSILIASVSLFAVTAMGYESWAMIGINGLFSVMIPIIITQLIFNVAFHRLPHNLFLYIFLCAFFPGALIIAVKMILLGGYYVIDGYYDWLTVKDNFLVLIPLMLFPEGMLNGMTMTLLVIYKPHWVYTFNDKFYLSNK